MQDACIITADTTTNVEKIRLIAANTPVRVCALAFVPE